LGASQSLHVEKPVGVGICSQWVEGDLNTQSREQCPIENACPFLRIIYERRGSKDYTR
jgi:hypothetical protein